MHEQQELVELWMFHYFFAGTAENGSLKELRPPAAENLCGARLAEDDLEVVEHRQHAEHDGGGGEDRAGTVRLREEHRWRADRGRRGS